MRLKQAKFPVTFAWLKRLKIMHENKFYLRLTLFHYNLLDLLEWFRILLKLFTSFFWYCVTFWTVGSVLILENRNIG